MRKLLAGLILLAFSSIIFVRVSSAASLVAVQGSLSATGYSTVLYLNGQSTCSAVFSGTASGFSVTFQSSSDNFVNSDNTATTLGNSGVATALGTYTGNILATTTGGTTAFRVDLTSISSGSLHYVLTCTDALGASGGGGGSTTVSNVPTVIPSCPASGYPCGLPTPIPWTTGSPEPVAVIGTTPTPLATVSPNVLEVAPIATVAPTVPPATPSPHPAMTMNPDISEIQARVGNNLWAELVSCYQATPVYYNDTTATTWETVISGTSGERIYLCGALMMANSTAVTGALGWGASAACSSVTQWTANFPFQANGGANVIPDGPFASAASPLGDNLCVYAGGSSGLTITAFYVEF